MRPLGNSRFCACTFFGKSADDDGEKYGANGLPVTPSSIRILGRFQKLKMLDHDHLCRYLDIQRGKYGWLTVEEISRFSFHILHALNYLHSHGFNHGYLSSNNAHIILHSDGSRTLRLSLYGLPHMTNCGKDVDFPIGHPWYLSPELIASGLSQDIISSTESDIWAFGILLLEMVLMKQMVGVLAKIVRSTCETSALKPLLEAVKLAKPSMIFSDILENFRSLIEQCLSVNPSSRPAASTLLENSVFINQIIRKEPFLPDLDKVFVSCKRTGDLTPQNFRKFVEFISHSEEWLERPISERPIEEVYCLWKLAGSSVEVILKRMGLTKVIPPIKSVPQLVIEECEMFGHERSRRYLTDLTLVPLSLKNLEHRLNSVDAERFFVSLEVKYGWKGVIDLSPTETAFCPLPTVVKERDIEYQLDRMIIFQQLINAYPFKQAWLWKECRIDIPPLYRGLAWAALLNVKSDVSMVYNAIDKETYTPTDRQVNKIEVDIPRCHQYDELLSSPEGHSKFKRILKAWVNSHSQYVYWQGLDSLSAPFLYLNFNNEALAYACLSAFIPRYLHKFFLKDNAAVIQEYLAVFNHLIAFHDPELYIHLRHIGFVPELYAIPWFLTMFAHVFPLHKLFHLWDTLLLGDSSFPLCVGVSILLQLRDRLLHYGFNECILLFSDLPEIDIARCVEDSVELFIQTPKSATYRQHALSSEFKEFGFDKLSGKLKIDQRGGSFTDDLSKLKRMPELEMDPIPLESLKEAVCARICGAELIQLWEMKLREKPVLAVDIRSTDDFSRGSAPASLNIPFSKLEKEELPGSQSRLCLPGGCPAVEHLGRCKGNSIIVIVGRREELSFEFAEILVRMGYSRVCVLHKGIDVFKRANLLTLPPAEL